MTKCPQQLVDLVVKSVHEFYESSGGGTLTEPAAAVAAVAVRAEDIFSASLGFSGDQIKGALVVTTYAAVLQASNPQREYKTSFDEADHADWIGETINQIVGNLKRHLGKVGVKFTLSTPTVMSGKDFHLTGRTDTYHHLNFALDGHKIKISMTAELAADVQFVGASADEQAEAGNVMFL